MISFLGSDAYVCGGFSCSTANIVIVIIKLLDAMNSLGLRVSQPKGSWSPSCKRPSASLPRPQQLAFPVTEAFSSSRSKATSINSSSSTYPSPFPPPPLMATNFKAHYLNPQVLESLIERAIYRFRFMTIFGVAGSLMGSVLCFLKGCVYVMNSFTEYIAGSGKVILTLVEAIDIYLIGTVMLVFGMGLYELFISNLDIGKKSHGSNLLGFFKLRGRPGWLEIQSVNELKTKLGHAIVMVLLVGLFEKSKKVTISSSGDLLCFTASIFLLSGCLYLLSKLHSSKPSLKSDITALINL